MKKILLLFLSLLNFLSLPMAQNNARSDKHRQDIHALIDAYALARENRDTTLLKSILTPDTDQLVSSGEWRRGIRASIDGMLRSSENNPGSRRLTVENIRFLDPGSAIVDARYEIENPDGTVRKMWSTFIAVYQEDRWKITAIRNMRPTGD